MSKTDQPETPKQHKDTAPHPTPEPDGVAAAPEGEDAPARKPRALLSPFFLGALAAALVASAISVGVVLKAGRLEEECRVLRAIARDPGNLGHYARANAVLLGGGSHVPGELTVVFGSSFGSAWETLAALRDTQVINRSLAGQSTTQMLLRFEQDVLALEPRTVVMLPPLAGVTHPERLVLHECLMGEMAAGCGIQPVLATIPPVPEALDTVPGGYVGGIQTANRKLAALAAEHGWPLLDLHARLVGEDFYLREEYRSADLWPNAQGDRCLTEVLAEFLAAPAAEPDLRLAAR